MQQRENSSPGPPEQIRRPGGCPPCTGDVLIAEDDEVVAERLRGCLTQAGYEVRTVQTGREGLEAVEDDPPELILMGEAMPGLDGYEVTRRLKASDAARFIPIVILDGAKKRYQEQRAGPGSRAPTISSRSHSAPANS